jgi:hypothetical protein
MSDRRVDVLRQLMGAAPPPMAPQGPKTDPLMDFLYLWSPYLYKLEPELPAFLDEQGIIVRPQDEINALKGHLHSGHPDRESSPMPEPPRESGDEPDEVEI